MAINRLLLAVCLLLLAGGSLPAEEFIFGGNLNGLAGQGSKTLVSGRFTMTLEVTRDGAVMAETDSRGLGVNSRGIAGATDPTSDKFDVLGGTLAGEADQVRFWFDRDGFLRDLDFDGVSDEDYEYFLLQTPTSPDLYFFDSFNGSTADPGLISVPGVVHFLQEAPGGGGSGPVDDRSRPLGIPFTAGQVFVLTYGELADGNGAKWQGVTVVPEPCTALLLVASAVAASRARTRR